VMVVQGWKKCPFRGAGSALMTSRLGRIDIHSGLDRLTISKYIPNF
jgi:hypothetical protein